MPETYAVVGAGLAGVRAVEALRSEGFGGRVVLIGGERHLPYDRPPLSKELLLGTKTSEDVLLHDPGFYREQGVELRRGVDVTRLRPREGSVELADGGLIRADKVLLCTGSRPQSLQIPGADLAGVRYLRTLGDALAIRADLLSGCAVVVVGGGFIGVELAAAARSLGNSVTVLERDAEPLSRALGDVVGARLRQWHVDRGVRVHTSVGVEAIEGDHHVRRVVTTDGRRIEADLVVVGIGAEPQVRLAQDAGLATGNGILVNEFCETSNPRIYAAGDVAHHPNSILGEHLRLEHWQNAQNQAIAAARSMLGRREPYRQVPWFWSDQGELTVQVAGHPRAGDTHVWRGDLDALEFTAFHLRNDLIVGATCVNRRRDARAAIDLIARGARPDPQLLADPAVDLRSIKTTPTFNHHSLHGRVP